MFSTKEVFNSKLSPDKGSRKDFYVQNFIYYYSTVNLMSLFYWSWKRTVFSLKCGQLFCFFDGETQGIFSMAYLLQYLSTFTAKFVSHFARKSTIQANPGAK